MIYCDECGWAYKRKVQNGITYWVCSRKGNSGHECGGKNLLESEIFSSFIIMYNRLRQYETLLVDNTLTQLIDIRTKFVSGSQEIAEIDAEIAKLCSQNDMYSKLRAKNIMDEVSYVEQTAELQNRITTLRSRRLKLIRGADASRSHLSLLIQDDGKQWGSVQPYSKQPVLCGFGKQRST